MDKTYVANEADKVGLITKCLEHLVNQHSQNLSRLEAFVLYNQIATFAVARF